jgi:PAS domain S-box-containing protein
VQQMTGTVPQLEIITEITERKTYEQQILKEKNLLQQVMETSPVGITMVDEKGKISMANARAEEILGLKRSDIYKMRYNDQEWQITDIQGNEHPDDQLPFELVKKTGKSVFGIKHSLAWPDGKNCIQGLYQQRIGDYRKIHS